MTDRELFELAVKAAGLVNPRFVENTPWGTGVSHGDGDGVYIVWNPLTDDGDALRLAVQLGLFESIDFHLRLCQAQSQDDPYEATRRAITRAAAEIGRNMK